MGVNLCIICIPPSESVAPTDHRPCSPVVFTVEKHLHVSGPMQFRSALFQGQLSVFACLLVYCLHPGPWVLLTRVNSVPSVWPDIYHTFRK